jgi:PASTA domain
MLSGTGIRRTRMQAVAQARLNGAGGRPRRRSGWHLAWVGVLATLIAACSSAPPSRTAASSPASVHPLGTASATATATSSDKASPAQSSPRHDQPSSHQASPSIPPTGTVPNVLGVTLANATSAVYAAGFSKYSWLYSCYGSAHIGQVVRQIPAPGAQVARTTHVRLYLQAGNCAVTVPNVVGMSFSAAVAAILRAGFHHYHWVYKCLGSSNIGAVVTQSPAAGTSYGAEETVSIQLQANNC